jgi:uncharacterized protein (TIGR02246 family)
MTGETGMSFRDQMEEIQGLYMEAFRRGDAMACADFFTEDAIYVTAGLAPVKGRAAIKELHDQIIESGFEVHGRTLTQYDQKNGLAYAFETLETQNGTHTCLLVLRLESDGKWRVCIESEVAHPE